MEKPLRKDYQEYTKEELELRIQLEPDPEKRLVLRDVLRKLERDKESESKVGNPSKEPWQMTRAEYLESRATKGTPEELANAHSAQVERAMREGKAVPKAIAQEIIRQALSEGKPIPPEVLADYPALQPKSNTGKLPDKIERFEALLDDLADKYGVSTTRVARILLANDIRSVDDIESFEDVDSLVASNLTEGGAGSNPKGTIEHSMDAWLLLHSVPHAEKEESPGIVVDADVAARTPCTVYAIGDSEIAFSRGVVGALSEAQKEAYCPTKEYKRSPGIERRLRNWQEAVGVCKKEIKDIPKGEKLEPWLKCLSKQFTARDISV